MKTSSSDRQSLLDVALRYYGDIESALFLAIQNDIALTDDLEIGQVIKCDMEVVNKNIVNHYEQNKIIPSTALTKTIESGINYMGIEIDFRIS